MSRRLTVQEKILLHLTAYARYAEEFECPEDISQSGIAAAIGKSRAHATLELKKLKDEDMVTERLSYVKGAKVKKKVYALAPAGQTLAMNLRRIIGDMEVSVRKDGRSEDTTGERAMELLADAGITGVKALIAVSETEGDIEPAAESADADERVDARPPAVDGEFFGRERELEEVAGLLESGSGVAVVGLSGMGKTAFAGRLAADMENKLSPAYVKVYDFDSPLSVARGLASKLGCAPEAAATVRDILWQLGSVLSEKGHLLILDDYDAADGLDDLTTALVEMLESGPSGLLTLSEDRPGICAPGSAVAEYSLGGLDIEAAVKLLESGGRFTDAEKMRGIARLTGGHPLALKLAGEDSPSVDLEEMMFGRYLSGGADAEFLALAAVLRRGFDPVAAGFYGFSDVDGLSRSAAFGPLGGGRFAMLEPLRRAVLKRLGESGARKAHASAVDYCRGVEEEPSEVLFHLARAGMHDGAAEFALTEADYFLTGPNMDDTFKILDSVDCGSPEFLDLKAEAANVAGRWEEAEEISGKLAAGDFSPDIRFGAGLRRARIAAKRGDNRGAAEILEGLDAGGVGKDLLASYRLFSGVVSRNLGDFGAAGESLAEAAALAKECGDRHLLMRCRMENGSLAMISGDESAAGRDMKAALEMAEGLGSAVDAARVRLNLGLLAVDGGDIAGAMELYAGAADAGRELGLPRILGYGLVGMAECLNRRDSPEDSMDLSREAISIFEDLGAGGMAAAAYSNIGTSFAKTGDSDSARLNFNMGIGLCSGTQSPLILGQIYYEYGLGCRLLGDPDGAAENLEKAREIFADMGAAGYLAKAEEALGDVKNTE